MQLELPFLAEPPRAAPGRPRRVQLGGRIVPYVLRRTRRRTIGIVVDERGLAAAAPRWATVAEVEAFIREQERWVLRRIDDPRFRPRAPFVWREGARLPYLGREMALARGTGRAPGLAGDRLEVPAQAFAAGPALREAVIGWLKAAALALFHERVAHLAPALRVAAPTLRLSSAASRWGSCARAADGRGRVLLHWRLVHFELPLIDYVVAHELAHLRHMNHSDAFWRLVETVHPDQRAARRALRARGHQLPDL